MATVETAILVLDSGEPEQLAEFYAGLLGEDVTYNPQADRFETVGASGTRLGFRRDTGFAPPSWPRPDDAHQTHLELLVAEGDMDEAERAAITGGARPVDTQRDGVREVRLYSDPAGHTFALRTR
ncbi:VOC family protein [Streptomyces sp. AN091965]|uniref:VOC family protein n=1 Tax=Streptomyces sp. AN091965 TaxID=2927803 RepID=UPI001F602F78|nr:VOC family protein [Streptomyces sp. AN091965]MCI3934639.1 VOC family protein [Streptomyces sp. AN091965]